MYGYLFFKRGLRLSEEKTQIVHLSEGFDFLGFNIRHYPAPNTARSGYKLLIKPSKESVLRLKERVRREWMTLKGHNIMAVLKRINPIVRGWANYFRIGVSKSTPSRQSTTGCSIAACATSGPITAAKAGDGAALTAACVSSGPT